MKDVISGDLSLRRDEIEWLRRRVRKWYRQYGRRFRWRETGDAFHILIAELLLQRTRADLVPVGYESFVERYPDARALAIASPEEVIELLRPLGLLHRSARLPALGRALVRDYGGSVPQTEAALLTLPGVGRYVANAVLLVAFDQSRPLLDPNVIRLLERCFGVASPRRRPRDDLRLWKLLQQIVPRRAPRPVALGLIDLGSLVCLPKHPRCEGCPLNPKCLAFRTGGVVPREGS